MSVVLMVFAARVAAAALMPAVRFELVQQAGLARIAGRLAATFVEHAAELFAPTMMTTVITTTRRRRRRRNRGGLGRRRRVSAREPGRRYQQESSIHDTNLPMGNASAKGRGRSDQEFSTSENPRSAPKLCYLIPPEMGPGPNQRPSQFAGLCILVRHPNIHSLTGLPEVLRLPIFDSLRGLCHHCLGVPFRLSGTDGKVSQRSAERIPVRNYAPNLILRDWLTATRQQFARSK
jgi:hypothetical protein